MQLLPTGRERRWLDDALGTLIRTRGPEPLVSMPIVEPSREYFPDRWAYSHRGLDRLARRLMQYARLEHLDVAIGTFDDFEDRQDRFGEDPGGLHVAAMFLGIEDSTCYFAFNESSPSSEESTAGIMAHEVAHAYRAFHGLVTGDRNEEELLTDVTTVYLGFGILAANNAFRFRTSGWIEGHTAVSTVSLQQAGYLSPQAFAYLLACQITSRRMKAPARRRLLRYLEADQAAFARAGLDNMESERDSAMERWGVSTRLPVSPTALDEILRPLPAFIPPPASEANPDAEEDPELYNTGAPVFRVAKSGTAALPWLIFAGGTGGLIGWVAILLIGLPPAVVLVPAIAGGATGYWLGRRRSNPDLCSDPDCLTSLEPDLTTCPTCGGSIVGTIDHQDQRLEAEEAYRRGRASSPSSDR